MSELEHSWPFKPDPAKPLYECPDCKAKAVQFYRQLADHPARTEFFRCCACGRAWEI